MTQTFTSTQNEIIRYVYNETSHSENTWIENQLVSDTESLDFYLDCLFLKEELNKISLSPKQNTLDSIFEYSRNYKPAI